MLANECTWTAERVELLKISFQPGLSCRENAASAQRRARKRGPSLQHRRLGASCAGPQPAADDEPIHNGHCCSLLELSEERCRWPISTPGAEDFCFCGNTPFEGLPYCAGHARLAYRPGSRQRVARG